MREVSLRCATRGTKLSSPHPSPPPAHAPLPVPAVCCYRPVSRACAAAASARTLYSNSLAKQMIHEPNTGSTLSTVNEISSIFK